MFSTSPVVSGHVDTYQTSANVLPASFNRMITNRRHRTFPRAPDSICTLELPTELRDRTASPRMRHRTPNDQAHLAPVPDPVLPYRSTARRSAQVVKLRQNDDTVLCGGRPIPPVRRSDAFMAPAQGRQRSPGAMPSPASSSGIERLAAAVRLGSRPGCHSGTLHVAGRDEGALARPLAGRHRQQPRNRSLIPNCRPPNSKSQLGQTSYEGRPG